MRSLCTKTWDPAKLKRYRLYTDLAYLWPIISPPEEYAEEAVYWRRALRKRLGSGKHHILELGVGGGHLLSHLTLAHLTTDFQGTAVDISPQMLELSKKLNPGVDHYLGDMRTFRLGRTFDAVLIHDAISYMLSESDLSATFLAARDHLRPEGVLLVAPEWVRESFANNRTFKWVRKNGDLEVSIQEYLHDPDPDDTQVESIFSYEIREKGQLRREQDIHTTGLFPIATWTRLMKEVGFRVETLKIPANEGGYGEYLFLGVLPAPS